MAMAIKAQGGTVKKENRKKGEKLQNVSGQNISYKNY